MRKIFLLFVLLPFACSIKAQTFSWNGNQQILDNQSYIIPITVSGLPAAIDTNFGVAHICLNITHPYLADLHISLISPTGTSVVLIQDIGGAGDNFYGTCLGMDGTAFTNAIPPYSGIFFPAGDVSSFNNGQNPNGTWQLVIEDIASPDEGNITSAYIEFTNNPPRQIASSGSGAPVGTYVCPTCICPGGGLPPCDLLPDMTSSAKEIELNHLEEPGFLYISNATPNIGYGPIDIYGIDSCFCGTTRVPCGTICPGGEQLEHIVKQRIYQKVPGTDTLSYYDRIAGKMIYHVAHGHLHVDDWAKYTLRTPTANPDARTWPIVASGTKQSFCLINLGSCDTNPGECKDNNGNTVLTVPNNGIGWHTGCGKNQGIYPGKYDVYSISLNDPMPLENVCNGNYYIVSITDPNNEFLESDENNNWVAVPITLTKQNVAPIITANGPTVLCDGESVTLTASTETNYLWSTGATTQSIVVTTPGTYTVSTTCGTSTTTSLPVTITVIPANSTASVNIGITTGSNPTCPGVTQVFTATPTNGGNIPSYQWKVNGANVGSNSPTFTTSSLTNGQVVTCVLTSNINCLSSVPVVSNSIVMSVSNPVDPSVTISQTGGNSPACIGEELSFTANTVNAVNPVFQWKVNGIAAGTNANTFTSTTLSNGQVVQCDIISPVICPVKSTLGTGTTVNDYRSDLAAAYPTYYGNGRQQYLVLASELSSLGFLAGNINSLGFTLSGNIIGNPATLNGYTIKIAQTSVTELTGAFQTPAFTTVFGPVNYTPVLNTTNTHLFSTPFTWDGNSNIIVDICFSNQVIGSAAYQNKLTPTAFVSTTYYQADGSSGALACSRTTGISGSVRPNMEFTITPVKTKSSNQVTLSINDNNIYTFTGSGNWSEPANWSNNQVPPSPLPSCSSIFIDPPAGQECILDVTQVISQGATIKVMQDKKFRIPGNLIMQ